MEIQFIAFITIERVLNEAVILWRNLKKGIVGKATVNNKGVLLQDLKEFYLLCYHSKHQKGEQFKYL